METLQDLRQALITLKEDRTKPVKSVDVVRLYDQLCAEYQALHEPAANGVHSEQDRLLDDCFQLVSLFFLTIGRTNEPPATYAPALIVKLLTDHLTESGNYSLKDLAPIESYLNDCQRSVDAGRPHYNPVIIDLLTSKLDACYTSLKPLQQALDGLAPELQPTYEKLISLRRSIKACEAKRGARHAEGGPRERCFRAADVEAYLEQVREIDKSRVDGKFVSEDGSTTPEQGQEMVATLLQRCYEMAAEVLERKGRIPPGLERLADELDEIRSSLAKLEMTQAWALRETDLFDYIKKLRGIDETRVDGMFVDEITGKATEEGQSVLVYMLRRSYAHVYTLMSSSKPVSEALMPVYNQLQTVRRCLKEVQKYGIQHPQELYPYSMKLASIDNMRQDGKFIVNGDVPEGQGRVTSLLAECFDICQELRASHEPEVESG